MKHLNTQELVSTLKSFPNNDIETFPYLGQDLVTIHKWRYSPCNDSFALFFHGDENTLSEADIYQMYGNVFWCVKPFFFLKGNTEKLLAVRLVESLIVCGHIEDVICEYGINDIRICEHCHQPMNEGWIVDDFRTFCSDECLLEEFPNIDIDHSREGTSDGDSTAYWTSWEG